MMRRASLLVYVTAPSMFLFACGHAPAQTSAPNDTVSPPVAVLAAAYGDDVKRDLERVRAATAAFKDITAAHAVGYPTMTPRCVENPGMGGMGHHYVKRDLLDDKLDVEHPEILVYAPTEHGKQKLVGVEYIVPYSARSRDKEAPEIFGQKLRRADDLNLWYLHVWAWEENKHGLFADWNPAVRCDQAAGSH